MRYALSPPGHAPLVRTIFPTVMSTCVRLTNSKDQTMYLLCFASANPSPKVKALVTRLAAAATKA